ncbi:YggT family protein [Pandoraea nosoerga]|uniref:YggT family protein n=1 Tax=Pandoraea nosoerga TaxID=2508296 RepID=UPI0019809613|nr:YggT family protein [Pandoraea nosoerga]MBN4744604.1 YggT family protein [Pandoraea nosoerga]
MLVEIARLLLDLVFSLFGALLLLRVWMQMTRLPPRNPLSQGIFQFTNWIVLPLRRVLPGVGGIDWACVVGAWLCAVVYLVLITAVVGVSPVTVFPRGLLVALVLVAKWGGNLVMWLTLLMAVLSWVNPRATAMPILQHLLDPLLRPLRRVIPMLGGFDLSPLALFVLMQILLIVLARLSLFFAML